MKREWTREQQQVIRLEGRNLLVSAAAGSGKTAVLVERIIRKITDRNHPVDIDRLLIVTFTNAAAAEMRERISAAIGNALEKQPDNVHLQRQQTLLHNAQITTIHSFCRYVIRNYFHRISMDPDFRLAEEGELKLLRNDVLDDVLEQYYKEADPDFLILSETVAPGKTDQRLKEAVLNLFSFAMSYPWVEEWLERCRLPYHVDGMEAFDSLAMTGVFLDYMGNLSAQWARQIRQCGQICLEQDGPARYAQILGREGDMLENVLHSGNYREYYERIGQVSFARLPSVKKSECDAAKKDRVQKLRNEVKNSVNKAKAQFFFQSPEKTAEDVRRCRPTADMLINVTLSFLHAFSEKKREKNILDFNDLEHFALKILIDEETHTPSLTAQELGRNYEEIMIDEYQDSNYVQEEILRAVSREAEGGHNIFMVGDVKQSIYRFRMARPELFMEKYAEYTIGESVNQRIDLHKNFRSRTEVIDTVNDIFCRLMQQDIGNITYDSRAALYPGAEFPDGKPGMFDTRILVVSPDEGQKNVKTTALEAEAAGVEIRRLMKEQLVRSEEPSAHGAGGLRPVRYSDIVILLRSMSGQADTFVQTLNEMGIPARAATGTGYFSAPEVQTALNLLRVLDNPRQDIPMAAVLASPIVGLSGEELAILRVRGGKEDFCQAVWKGFQGEGAQDVRKEEMQGEETEDSRKDCLESGLRLSEESEQKLCRFLRLLQKYRKKVSYIPIHQLLYEILDETGYQDYVYALPGGEVKKANLEMLVEKAITYESTSYRGLFHFIRYMEQLQKYEVDFPLADGGETEDAVRIMSIHKSKGLEFPIVFVSGLGKELNNQDIRERIVFHPTLGIGMDRMDIKKRLRIPGFTRQLLARQITMENIGEELRVLYVALTRAKERLILTGVLKKAQEKLAGLGIEVRRQDGTVCMEADSASGEDAGCLSFLKRLNANSFLQFVLLASCAYPGKYPVVLVEQADLADAGQAHIVEEELSRIELLARLQAADSAWDEKIRERLDYVYPYEEECTMRTKVSVSELKHRAMDRLLEEELEEEMIWQKEHLQAAAQQRQEEASGEKEPEASSDVKEPEEAVQERERYVPAFMEGLPEENMGAKRGTAMHRVLECYDFRQEAASLEEQVRRMEEEGRIDGELRALISIPALKSFLAGPLGERMREAAHRGKLYKEKPFVMGKPAKEALEESGSEEMLLIQGIIDVFFEEDDGIVLLDYKTDRVRSGRELADRYRAQMDLYEEALVRALEKPVKEKLLYSFCLGEVISIQAR